MCLIHEISVRSQLVTIAESLIGSARYCYLSEKCIPPETVNCGMFVRWVYMQKGFWRNDVPPVSAKLLPSLKEKGRNVTEKESFPGDLIFTKKCGWDHDHVGLITFNDKVVHACSRRGTVVSDTVIDFLQDSEKVSYISLLDSKEIDLYGVVRYLKGKLSFEMTKMIDQHISFCMECHSDIQLIRSCRAWRRFSVSVMTVEEILDQNMKGFNSDHGSKSIGSM